MLFLRVLLCLLNGRVVIFVVVFDYLMCLFAFSGLWFYWWFVFWCFDVWLGFIACCLIWYLRFCFLLISLLTLRSVITLSFELDCLVCFLIVRVGYFLFGLFYYFVAVLVVVRVAHLGWFALWLLFAGLLDWFESCVFGGLTAFVWILWLLFNFTFL